MKMQQVINKYFCDYCNAEMGEFEYQQGTKVGVRVDLPNPKGGCGQVAGVSMVICKNCSVDLGIVNCNEYHDYTYSQSKLKNTVKEIKNKIVDMLYKKN